MSAPMFDAMAGERARAIRADPGAPHPIVDPTDPRCRQALLDSGPTSAGFRPIVDPTDPQYGRRAD